MSVDIPIWETAFLPACSFLSKPSVLTQTHPQAKTADQPTVLFRAWILPCKGQKPARGVPFVRFVCLAAETCHWEPHAKLQRHIPALEQIPGRPSD
ncbi:hypothetical protein TWF192_011540 [Orbilia oligospora]|uniref:Uncharacterized protein n=1 Tax=Orbilia oligospora TaxID=2813651 RepID=A0A6G1LRM4_ORBOL|nr:hypothetical protein TWF191_011424 [Orbilia oligospora]KAF3229973.1 hypothetical protein TWF192_011540 [Orbilia oligospora]